MGVKERWRGTKEIRFSTDEAVALILPILQREHHVLAAYLFGSRAKEEGCDKAKRDADMDIAIHTARDFSWEDYYRLYGELTKALHSDRLDLVWLNKAEPIIAFEVIKTGKVLFYRDADALNEFELMAKKRYYDHVLYLKKRREMAREVNGGL